MIKITHHFLLGKLVIKRFALVLFFIALCVSFSRAQVEERPRPADWENMVPGGRFMDLFKPIPTVGELEKDTWGAEVVIPRYVDNGIEDEKWSYWGGNILKDEAGKYHMFVCRWPEDSPKGHMEWPNSVVVHAVSENSIGPFQVVGEVGKGHNPEIFRLKDGRYIVYVIDGYYLSESPEGPWAYGQFDFDPRGREIIEGLSNLSFAQREDGSYLMVCRGGGIWVSKDGISTYEQVSDKRAYPDIDGRFEDPVIWKDHVQYHMIVNDWLGRIAYYLRSPDGIHWKTDPGEAYKPGITVYEDSTQEDWFKYERIKILQDDLGRAIQANFAVIDTLKHHDKPNDHYSSKNISIPLTVGRQLEILNKEKISNETKEIKVLIKSEDGFDSHKDMNLSSLRFGAPEEVDFGRGSKLKSSQEKGSDLVLVFEGKGNGLTVDNFAAKLLGKDKNGELVFGYSKLPGAEGKAAILSAGPPEMEKATGHIKIMVKNYGQHPSKKSKVILEGNYQGRWEKIGEGKVNGLKPYEEHAVTMDPKSKEDFAAYQKYRISLGEQQAEVFDNK